MKIRLFLELLELIAIAVLVIYGLRFAFRIFMREHKPHWSTALERRRLSLMLLALLAVVALNVGEDVLDGDSRAIDVFVLLSLRDTLGSAAVPFFEKVTLSGSWMFLTPLTTIVCIALWLMKRRFEAFLLAASSIGGALTVYVVKSLVARERPALWDTETYWGSSFPSGHTLVVTAVAIALVLCTMRIRPALKGLALSIGLLWIALMGLSRLVLGVHWPTDVLVAACIGAALPISISVLHELWYAQRAQSMRAQPGQSTNDA